MVADEHTDDDVIAWLNGLVTEARNQHPVPHREVRYGPAADQVVDLYGDCAAGEPLVINIHGGYFAGRYDRLVGEPFARAVAGSGRAVANVDYRRQGSSQHPRETVDDVRRAIDAVIERCHPGSVTVVGHSAGGYLALSAAGHPGVSEVVALAPVTDLERCDAEGWDSGEIRSWFGSRADDAEHWVEMRLDSLVPTPTARVRVVHGSNDTTVPLEHSLDFERSRPHWGIELDVLAVGHFEFMDPASPACRAIIVALSHG